MVEQLTAVILLLTAALQSVTGQGGEPSRACRQRYTKVGCFRDNIVPDRPFKQQLLNRIDKHSKKNDGIFVDLDAYPESLHQLVCKCNQLAAAGGFTNFGIQLYGECWAGNGTEYQRDGVSTECVRNDMTSACNNNSTNECAGKCGANYVYKVNRQVDGGWSLWKPWSSCIGKCETIGKRNRSRTCTKPAPKQGGKLCSGESTEIDDCKTGPCPSWASWGGWSQCVATRLRECVSEGKNVDAELCGIKGGEEKKICKKCQGNWGVWGSWGACFSSKPCEAGKKKRSRVCLPFPGFVCNGPKDEEISCPNRCQRVWTGWGAWGSCSKPCGGGSQTRSRRCVAVGHINVVLTGCLGPASQTNGCNIQGCPVWGPYGSWGACSVTCGTGSRRRHKICVIAGTSTATTGCPNPRPFMDGSCVLPGCPVWSGWSSWSPCKKCRNPNEIVRQTRTRRCVQQGSNNAASGCQGFASESKNCALPDCDVRPRCRYDCLPTDIEGVVCARDFRGTQWQMANECAFKRLRKCARPRITMTRGRCLINIGGGGGGTGRVGGGGGRSGGTSGIENVNMQ